MNMKEFVEYQQSKGFWNLEGEIKDYLHSCWVNAEKIYIEFPETERLLGILEDAYKLHEDFVNKSDNYLDIALEKVLKDKRILTDELKEDTFNLSKEALSKKLHEANEVINNIEILKSIEEETNMSIILAPTNFGDVLRNAVEKNKVEVFDARDVRGWGLRIPTSPHKEYQYSTIKQQLSEMASKGILNVVSHKDTYQYYSFPDSVSETVESDESRFFIDDVWFQTEIEAIEYCRQHIIKKKTRKIIWE